MECLESVQRVTYLSYRIGDRYSGFTGGSMEKAKAWAAGELLVESKFFAYDPSTKPVRWIEYDRATAEAGGLPELEAKTRPCRPIAGWSSSKPEPVLWARQGNNMGLLCAL